MNIALSITINVIVTGRVVSPEISQNLFQTFRKFPEIYIENFPAV